MNYIKNIFRKYINEHINKQSINESDTDDFYENISNLPYQIFYDIKNKEMTYFKLMPKEPYHNALKEFMQYGTFVRFPEKYIFDWKELLLDNIAKLNALTEIHGHSSNFPYDEFYDIFDTNEKTGEENNGRFTRWVRKQIKMGKKASLKYDFSTCYEFLDEVYHIDDYTPQFSNGHHVLSDFATEPLLNLAHKLCQTNDPDKIIVLINQILDVTHQRSDIAEIFIQGGSKSLDYISNS
jgi:hypothetical protein